MTTSFCSVWHAALIAVSLAQTVAALGQDRTAASPNHHMLEVERHLTLAPQPGNPRNSEGDFIQLKDGRWLFIYTHFTGGAEDHSTAYLAARESSDGGKSWSDKDQVVVPNEGGFNVMSVSLLRLKSGQIALLYLRKNSLQDCRRLLRLSSDEASAAWRYWQAQLHSHQVVFIDETGANTQMTRLQGRDLAWATSG